MDGEGIAAEDAGGAGQKLRSGPGGAVAVDDLLRSGGEVADVVVEVARADPDLADRARVEAPRRAAPLLLGPTSSLTLLQVDIV